MNVGIVGLGLIGGSMAKSIKARTGHTVFGIARSEETLMMARMCGAIDAPLTDENLPQCDLILIAIRPGAAIEWTRRHADLIAIGQRGKGLGIAGDAADIQKLRLHGAGAHRRGGDALGPQLLCQAHGERRHIRLGG